MDSLIGEKAYVQPPAEASSDGPISPMLRKTPIVKSPSSSSSENIPSNNITNELRLELE